MNYLAINSAGVVIGYSDKPHVDFPVEYDFSNSTITFEDVMMNSTVYKIENGQLVLSQTQVQIQNEQQKNYEFEVLTQKRKMLFKEYVDRGKLFYDELAEEPDKYNELKIWRQTWKDMPTEFEAGTWVEPALPSWLK